LEAQEDHVVVLAVVHVEFLEVAREEALRNLEVHGDSWHLVVVEALYDSVEHGESVGQCGQEVQLVVEDQVVQKAKLEDHYGVGDQVELVDHLLLEEGQNVVESWVDSCLRGQA